MRQCPAGIASTALRYSRLHISRTGSVLYNVSNLRSKSSLESRDCAEFTRHENVEYATVIEETLDKGRFTENDLRYVRRRPDGPICQRTAKTRSDRTVHTMFMIASSACGILRSRGEKQVGNTFQCGNNSRGAKNPFMEQEQKQCLQLED